MQGAVEGRLHIRQTSNFSSSGFSTDWLTAAVGRALMMSQRIAAGTLHLCGTLLGMKSSDLQHFPIKHCFFGAFAKMQIVTVSFVTSFCLSVFPHETT